MNAPLVDKMREIKAMQAAMHGKVINEPKSGFREGGKWEIVTKFQGKSHNDGGIDLEVHDGYVKRISGVDSPDDIAKNGRFWRSLGATAYGVGEGLLDTITLGATDQLTDAGYTALQKVAKKNTADEMREQDSLRGYGTTAGAITGAIVTGGSSTGSAIQQGTKGLGAGVSKGSPDSKFAQQVGTYLPLAGQIAGMAYGNKGYAKGSDMAKFANIAGKVGRGYGVANSFFNQQAAMSGAGASAIGRGAFGGAFNMSDIGSSKGGNMMNALGAGISGLSAFGRGGEQSGGTETGPDGDIFYSQVPMREDTLAYLTKYGVNT